MYEKKSKWVAHHNKTHNELVDTLKSKFKSKKKFLQ